MVHMPRVEIYWRAYFLLANRTQMAKPMQTLYNCHSNCRCSSTNSTSFKPNKSNYSSASKTPSSTNPSHSPPTYNRVLQVNQEEAMPLWLNSRINCRRKDCSTRTHSRSASIRWRSTKRRRSSLRGRLSRARHS